MVFDDLNALDLNGHTEKKKVTGKELTYLSWPWAWAEVKKRYPDAHYTVWKNEKGLPYTEDPLTGYMVYTSVTIEGITHEMWLPVMDGANKAMKREAYEYMTKFNGKKTCEAADMMDINKTIMRCLVKNLAMFGLGLYIYAGEDLPEGDPKNDQPKEEPKKEPPKPENGQVDVGSKLPPAPPKEEKPKEANQVTAFLLTAMAGMRKNLGLTPAQYNKVFGAQCKELVKAKLAPDKKLEEYTMEEASALIDAIGKCFDGASTEMKVE